MKIKIKALIVLLVLAQMSPAMLLAFPTNQPGANPQPKLEASVPSLVSTSTENGGMHTRADVDLPSLRYGSMINLNQPSITLEQLDAHSLTLEPNQIGVNRSVAVSTNTRAQKFLNPDGSQLVVLVIKSSGASGIGVHFRNFSLAQGEEVYAYGGRNDIVFGPFTSKGPWGSGEFWSGTVDGDTIVIEFYGQPDQNERGFEISEVSHIFAEFDSRLWPNEPDVLDCQVDASCYGDPQKNAVGRILFNDNGMFVCTGTLLNDAAQDHTPYFLTASHCVHTQAVAETVEVFWFYQTTSCNSGVLRSWVHSPPGTTLLRAQSSNDFSLLRLLSNPPAGALFSAWTSAVQQVGTSVFGLLHPDGYTPPSVPSYLRRATGSISSTDGACTSTGLVNGYIVDWTSGATEPGASGSGLFTSNGHYLVGLDSCSYGTCDRRQTWYSKLSEFYSQIRQYLDSAAPSAPVANPATFVTSHSFKANWTSVNGATGYRLDVATDRSFTNYVTGCENLNIGNAVSHSVSGLSPSSDYYYRVRAYNTNGGSDNSHVIGVTTLSPTGRPLAVTNPANMIMTHSAKLNGSVDPHGLTSTAFFQYGRTASYGSRTPNQTKTGTSYQNVGANISGLSTATTYHFRAVATNARGTTYGTDRTFTTH